MVKSFSFTWFHMYFLLRKNYAKILMKWMNQWIHSVDESAKPKLARKETFWTVYPLLMFLLVASCFYSSPWHRPRDSGLASVSGRWVWKSQDVGEHLHLQPFPPKFYTEVRSGGMSSIGMPSCAFSPPAEVDESFAVGL